MYVYIFLNICMYVYIYIPPDPILIKYNLTLLAGIENLLWGGVLDEACVQAHDVPGDHQHSDSGARPRESTDTAGRHRSPNSKCCGNTAAESCRAKDRELDPANSGGHCFGQSRTCHRKCGGFGWRSVCCSLRHRGNSKGLGSGQDRERKGCSARA